MEKKGKMKQRGWSLKKQNRKMKDRHIFEKKKKNALLHSKTWKELNMETCEILAHRTRCNCVEQWFFN